MAIQKPYGLNLIGKTIDAKEPCLITWKISGDLSVAYQVKIYNNLDNSISYDSSKVTSFSTSHSIPSNSLLNGHEYKTTITTFDSSNNFAVSDASIFQTSSRPVVIIDPISTIESPSYNFTASYQQEESASMRSWRVLLYNKNGVNVFQSPIQINSEINYLFSNLKSETEYQIEFQVTSSLGLVGTTGRIPFDVLYTAPNIAVNLTAENTDNAGIKLTWNTIQIIGATVSAPIFINSEKIDVRNDTFSFSDGFQVSRDFTLKLWLESITPNVDLLTLKGQNGTITLQYWDDDNRFHLFKDVYGYRSHNVSSELIGSGFFVFIQQINGDMNIDGEVI